MSRSQAQSQSPRGVIAPPHHLQSMASFRMAHANQPHPGSAGGSISSRFPVDANSVNSEHFLNATSILNKPLSSSVKQDMTWFGEFKDLAQRQLFLQFNRDQPLSSFFRLYVFFSSFFLFPLSLYLLIITVSNSSSSPMIHFHNNHSTGSGVRGGPRHIDKMMIFDFVCAVLILLYEITSLVCGWLVYLDHRSTSSSAHAGILWAATATGKMEHLSAVVVPLSSDEFVPPTNLRKSFFISTSSRFHRSVGRLRNSLFQWISPKWTNRSSNAIGNVFFISTQLLYIFLLLKISFITMYDQPQESVDTTCTIAYLLAVASSLLLFLPYFFAASLPEISIKVVWVILSMTLLFVMAMEIAMLCPRAIPVSFFAALSSVCLIIDFNRCQVQIFLRPSLYSSPSCHSSSDGVLSSNNSHKREKLEQNHANEMRHMIANVAHDLKTPLSSFITGMDYIQYILNDCQMYIINGNGGIAQLKDYVQNMQSCLNGIRNTNSFMLMTINRCIDFAKASRGFKLVPKFDTLDLNETLQLPLDCMRNLQDRIEIQLNPISPIVCSHIVTDKQWLQENILCLLSNAVKYSTKGTVTIDVMLTDDPVFEMEPFEIGNRSSSDPNPHPDAVIDFAENENGDPEVSFHTMESMNRDTLRVSQKVLPVNAATTNRRGSFVVGALPEDSEFFLSLHKKEKEAMTRHNSKNIRTQELEDAKEMRQKAKAELEKKSDQHLLFTIEDMGIGMTEEAMKELFSPFKQTQRLAGGTGLGLFSLAKRIEALQGKYGVTYRRDGEQGSLFWFSIPYKPDHITASIATSANVTAPSTTNVSLNVSGAKEVGGPKPTTSGNPGGFLRPSEIITTRQCISEKDSDKTHVSIVDKPYDVHIPKSLDILLVDDSPTIVKMTTMMLTKLGHRVTNAENGEAAIECILHRNQLRGESFDLILMDLQMPVMDGLEATKRIRNYEKGAAATPRIFKNPGSVSPVKGDRLLPKQKIIGMSANSDSEALTAASDFGMDMFIEKPFNISSFQEVVQKLFVMSH